MTYSCSVQKETLVYTLEDGVLRVSLSGGMELSIALTGGGLVMKKVRVFPAFFRVGLPLAIAPLIAFGAVYWKDGSINLNDLGNMGYLLAAYLCIGTLLLFLNRKPLTGYSVTRLKDGINVWRDPANPEAFEVFVAEIRKAMVS